MISVPILRAGGEATRAIELRAGPLTLSFEPDTAFVRHVRLGDHEVLRAVYAAIRDHNWATVLPKITIRKQEVGENSFLLAFDALCQKGVVDYSWSGTVSGDASGTIRFAFSGESHSDFQRNRIGICILHPIAECSGKAVNVLHTDGTSESGAFPKEISPHQPFFDIKSLSYEVVNTGIVAKIDVEGDVFEMEDQRNWSDASFKTYCTPQARPKPHPVKKGERVEQSVTLSLGGKVRPILPVNVGRSPQLSIATTPVFPLPPIGLCSASHQRPLSAREIERLKSLRLAHLRLDLNLSDAGYPALLEQVSNEAVQIGVGLHLALGFSADVEAQAGALLAHLQRLKPRVLQWIVLHEAQNPAAETTVQRARGVLQAYAPNVLFAAGTRDFFTEINRDRPPAGGASSVCYSNNPQVHAFDELTMIENLAGQYYNVETARTITPRPVVVSPITLRIRGNASAASEKPGLAELPGDVDARQMSLFGAGWTIGSIARLATTGFVHSLTYFETTGWRGLMETEAGSLLPAAFPSESGMVFPMYHVFADIAEFGNCQVYPTHSTHPLLADGLTLRDASGRRRVLVANFTRDEQLLKIKSGSGMARVRYLDETNALEAMRNPEAFRQSAGTVIEAAGGKVELKLLPYAVACVDLG
ncbi:MAG: hypothetical protein IPK15_05225 [Verrucomicrobia bacterium]|nr:hypothetical protein [Verrucomicrobiota bacterium]